jgi:prevent-host-death family protein
MTRWQLQEAKARFSRLVKSAVTEGPQEITVHGRPAAVLLSAEEYAQLSGRKPPFVEFMRQSPLAGAPLVLKRDRSRTRRVRV